MKLLIGLTGRTGSGKSSAARIFKKLGAYVSDCDKVAHEIILDNNIKERLCSLFSRSILDENGEINRKALGAIVFSDSEKLSQLNLVMHGAIVEKCIQDCIASGKDICLMDGSELESSGADSKCDFIIVITADEETRLARIMRRDGIDRDSALLRIKSQKEYSKQAIFIENNGCEKELEEKIKALYSKISGDIND